VGDAYHGSEEIGNSEVELPAKRRGFKRPRQLLRSSGATHRTTHGSGAIGDLFGWIAFPVQNSSILICQSER